MALGDHLPGEVSEFETLNGLVLAEVEVLGIRVELPGAGVVDSGIAIFLIVGDLGSFTVLVSFSDGTLGPLTGSKVIGGASLTAAKFRPILSAAAALSK